MNVGLLERLRTAREHPNVAALGAAFGGFVPIAAYIIVHNELRRDGGWDFFQPISPVALACLAFSVTTVWHWGHQSFRDKFKASCFVVALEGVMVCSRTPALCLVALAYLVLINAIATACTLVAEDKPVPQPTVTAVARELSLPRKAAAKVVDRQQQQLAKARPA